MKKMKVKKISELFSLKKLQKFVKGNYIFNQILNIMMSSIFQEELNQEIVMK